MLKPPRSYTLTDVEAIDVMTGSRHVFTVKHDGADVEAIRYDTVCHLPEASEQFTETEAAFLIDLERRHRMAEDSDVPHLKRFYL